MKRALQGLAVLGILFFIDFAHGQAKVKKVPQTPCQKQAKGTPAYAYCNLITSMLAATNPADKNSDARRLATFWTRPQTLPAAFNYSVAAALISRLQQSRLDNQTGTTDANGSTDLVSLPGTTDLISAAVGVGALTQSTTGTTTTVTANAGQLAAAFKAPYYNFSSPGTPFLKDLAVALSFTVNPGTPTPVATSAAATSTQAVPSVISVNTTSTQFSGVDVRYAHYNKFDPQSAQFQDALQQVVLSRLDKQLAADNDLRDALIALQQKYFTPAMADSDAAHFVQEKLLTDDLIQAIKDFNSYFRTIQAQVDVAHSAFQTDLNAFAQALQAKLNLYRETIEAATGAPALTAEYKYSQLAGQPQTHDVRLIGAWSPGGNLVTVNAAGSFYGSLPAGAAFGHFKDAQMAMQVDFPLGSRHSASSSKFDLSGAGYGQYQQNPSILNVSATDIPSGLNLVAGAPAFISGTQGWLGVFQAKLTVTAGNGVKLIPVSYKWSNHTDLFAQSSSTFQFGLSYDLSSLAQFLTSK